MTAPAEPSQLLPAVVVDLITTEQQDTACLTQSHHDGSTSKTFAGHAVVLAATTVLPYPSDLAVALALIVKALDFSSISPGQWKEHRSWGRSLANHSEIIARQPYSISGLSNSV